MENRQATAQQRLLGSLMVLLYRRPVTRRERDALLLSYLGIMVVFLQPLAVVPARLWLGVALVLGSAS